MVEKKEVLLNRKNIRDQLKATLFTKPKLDLSRKITCLQEGDENFGRISNPQLKKKKKTLNSNFFDEYELYENEVLGEGAHAIVKSCINLKDQKKYAVKITRSGDPEIINQVIKTYKLQKAVAHPNIIKVHKLFMDENTERIYFIMELCTYPSLKQILRKHHVLQEDVAKLLIKTVLYAVDAIHQKGICHRDLKPDNILVHSKDYNKIKIIDFGISSRFQVENLQINGWQRKEMFTKTGTLQYMAPEMFTLANYDESVDMWAIGIITYELLSGSTPFNHEYIMETQDLIKNCQYNFKTLVPKRWTQPVDLETINEASDYNTESTPLINPNKQEKINIQNQIQQAFERFQDNTNFNIWDTISSSAKDFIKRLIKVEKRLKVKDALLHPWLNSSQTKTNKKTTVKDDIIQTHGDQYVNSKLLQSTPLNLINRDSVKTGGSNDQLINSTTTINNNEKSDQPQLLTKSILIGKNDIFYNKREETGQFNFINQLTNSAWNKSYQSINVSQNNSDLNRLNNDSIEIISSNLNRKFDLQNVPKTDSFMKLSNDMTPKPDSFIKFKDVKLMNNSIDTNGWDMNLSTEFTMEDRVQANELYLKNKQINVINKILNNHGLIIGQNHQQELDKDIIHTESEQDIILSPVIESPQTPEQNKLSHDKKIV